MIGEAITEQPKGKIYPLLQKRSLLEEEAVPVLNIKVRNSCSKERRLTKQTTQPRIETLKDIEKEVDHVKEEPTTGKIKRKTVDKPVRASYRKLKTEGVEDTRNSCAKNGQLLNLTGRDAFKRKNREILHLLKSEESNYQRMHTEEVLFEHTMKRMTLESQDLIENYNSLTMEKKRVTDSLKRQDLRNPPPRAAKDRKHSENKPTPFLQYVRNKERSPGRGRSFLVGKMLEV